MPSDGVGVRTLFESSQAELQQLLATVDPLELLARAGFTRLMAELRPGKPPKGRSLEVFHLELLQAFSLAAPRAAAAAEADYPAVTETALRLIEGHAAAYNALGRTELSGDPGVNRRAQVLADVRSWTLAVRGPRHPHQTRAYLEAMAKRVDASFWHRFGCGAGEALAMLLRVEAVLEGRLRAEVEWRRRWFWDRGSRAARVEAFVEGMAAHEADGLRRRLQQLGLERDALRFYLWNEAERRLVDFFTLTAEDLLVDAEGPQAEALRGVLSRLSLGFGEVSAQQVEYVHLANPVRLQPFMRLGDDRYACPNPQSLLTGLAEVFEALCGAAPSLKANWEAARAGWLEAKVKAVVAAHLPDAEVRSNVTWTDPATGKGWESDVVAVLDKTVLIFEAKSGKLNPAARRGAMGSLKSDLAGLVVEPSEQSERLKAHLEAGVDTLSFETAKGPWSIDVSDLRAVARVNVLVDSIGALSTHWPQMKEAGLIPQTADIAPTMSIFELETVFEVLKLQIERCHYLTRRAELEANARYVADELDLLAFYLATQFNIGEAEFDGTPLHLYGLSMSLSARYSQQRHRGTPDLPIRRTPLVQAMLLQVEASKHAGWTRFGHRLLGLAPPEQKDLERAVRGAWKRISREPDHFFTSGVDSGPAARRQRIQFAIGAPADGEAFQNMLAKSTAIGLGESGLEDLLLIVWFAPQTGQAYNFVGVMRSRADPAGPFPASDELR